MGCEFEAMLKSNQLLDFYNSLEHEAKSWFKNACYTKMTVYVGGGYETGGLCNYKTKNMACYSIAHNLHFRKHYELALMLLDYGSVWPQSRDDLAMRHVIYAENYEKLKEKEKCVFHCEQAIKNGHTGTYAYKRLIIDYIKIKDWKAALRICDKVIRSKNENIHSLADYATRRKTFILEHMNKKN